MEAKAEECTDAQARARSTAQQLQQAQGELLRKVCPLRCKNGTEQLQAPHIQARLHLEKASCLTSPWWVMRSLHLRNLNSGMATPRAGLLAHRPLVGHACFGTCQSPTWCCWMVMSMGGNRLGSG